MILGFVGEVGVSRQFEGGGIGVRGSLTLRFALRTFPLRSAEVALQ